MPTIAAKDANGTTQTIQTLPAVGQGVSAASLPVVIASDQSAVPVSASALPLPTGAATGAKQDTGNTSLASIATALGSTLATSVADGSNITIGAKADTAATTDGGTFSLIALVKRLLGKIPGVGSATSAASLPVVIASDQAAVAVSLASVPSHAVTNAGTFAVQVTSAPSTAITAAALPLPSGASTAAKQPALGTAGTPSTDVLTVQGAASMTALKVDGSAVTQPVSLASVPSHAVTNAGAFAVQPTPTASANGATSSRINAAASTNATSLKASAGNLLALDVFNVAAYDVFLKFYNKASAPTVGTDTPVWTIPIKAGTGYSARFPVGKSFATGIAYAITKLQADSDTTVVAAGDVTGSTDWI